MISKWLVPLLFIDHCIATSPITDTKYGPIKGETLTIFNRKKVDAYLGVPYATPPTGPNRFAATRPPAPWNETIKTQSFSKSCIQPLSIETKKSAWFLYEGPESEDCLYLNIWKPSNCGEDKLPVMVWIHGGGFLGGSASMALYDGSILAAENNVVVVTMNYRLSMFGFFYLNSSEVPGNAGLQDQIMAMRWVRENIKNFGGNPERVTIFGESVGGTSVSLHLVNPALFDLFQYGIMESGNLYEDILTRTEDDVLETSLEVVGTVGCVDDDMQKMLDCLRAKPAEELSHAFFGFPAYVRLSFVPVRNGVEVPLVPSSAVQMVPTTERRNIMSLHIPLEAHFLIPSLFPDKNFTDGLSVDESELRVLIQNYFHLNDKITQDILIHEYRNFTAPYNEHQLAIEALDAVSDNLFICPGIDFTKSWVTEENLAFFMYFQIKPSKPIKLPVPNWPIVEHGDEILFVFGVPVDPKNGYTTSEANLSKAMMKYWTNFAKSGDPNDPSLVHWPSLEPNGNFTYLVINKNGVEPETFLKERECNFWDQIYPSLINIEEQLHNAI